MHNKQGKMMETKVAAKEEEVFMKEASGFMKGTIVFFHLSDFIYVKFTSIICFTWWYILKKKLIYSKRNIIREK